ncbi:MAG: hypothetical protein F6K37_37905 [Moorea sp. SIO4E2]|uniref:thioesterase domain-containing protein n=1 Tax=Moorena sp. SIO4E2 TaxID=2607826 RepID=UPI0013B9C7BF|nr:thioesterase domain-containing protein [Moorena sp. SIO4E2]NEQ11458.1 hypothetical protein [Moorena sp. SIO4E2]
MLPTILKLKALQAVQPNGPYLLGGHSFGGKVAFEMAQQLRNQGQEVSMLAIMDIQVEVPAPEKDAAQWDNIAVARAVRT